MIKEQAYKAAARSSHRRYKTGAVIVDAKGNILCWGTSHTPTIKMNNHLSIHSEIHALSKVRHLDLSGCSVYIATVSGKSGRQTSAKPCLHCAVALSAAGITKIHYTTRQGWVGPVNFEDELDTLKDYSVVNQEATRVNWEKPRWARTKRELKECSLKCT